MNLPKYKIGDIVITRDGSGFTQKKIQGASSDDGSKWYYYAKIVDLAGDGNDVYNIPEDEVAFVFSSETNKFGDPNENIDWAEAENI